MLVVSTAWASASQRPPQALQAQQGTVRGGPPAAPGLLSLQVCFQACMSRHAANLRQLPEALAFPCPCLSCAAATARIWTFVSHKQPLHPDGALQAPQTC